MRRRIVGVWAVAAMLGCGAEAPPSVFSIEIRADGGGPLLVTALGATLQLTATPRDAAGRPVTGVLLSWSSSRPSVAAVDAGGLVTAVANGTADISVSAGTGLGRTAVTVAQAPGSVAISPPSRTLERGATAAFTAAVVDARGHAVPGAAVVWTSQATSIATVAADGIVTGISAGSTLVTAAAQGASATASLVVTVPAPAAVAVGSTSAGPLASLDETRLLTAAARDARGALIPEATFTWASSDAAVVRVDPGGLVTAVANGTATVSATAGGISGSVQVVVAQAVQTVAVSPATQSIAPGATFSFTAQALDARAHPVAGAPAATWTIDSAAVATIDAATGRVLGNANASARSSTRVHAAIAGASGEAELTVDPSLAPVATVSLAPPAAALASLGDTLQLNATALNAAGNPVPGVAFSWSSDRPAVAAVDAATGRVTAVANGSALITASGSGRSASTSVVVQQAVAQVVLAPPAFTTFSSIDDTLQLAASAQDGRGHPVAGAPLVWSTSNAAVVSVSNTGLATARSNGASVALTATSGAFHDAVVLAVAQAVHAVNVTPSSDSIPPGTSLDFSAAGLDAHGHLVAGAPAAAWASSDARVTVDAAGHATAGSFASAAAVTITATIASVTGTAALTVDPALQPVDHVVVTGGGVSLASLGASVQLAAQAQAADGSPLGGHPISWAVQDGSADVVTVGPTGLVTAVGNGQKTVVASTGGAAGTTTITVAQVLASVEVSTATAGAATTLTSLGDTLALRAQGLDARGHALPPGSFAWRSDGPAATVDAAGLVTAVANGGAQVFAGAGAVESAGFAVAVAQAVDHVTVSAAGAATTLESLGATLQLTAAAFDARNHPVAATFTWSPTSGAAAVADAATGLVTAAANGSTSVQATAGGRTGSLTVTVAQVVSTVQVAGASTLSSLDETAQLSAVASDANGHAVPGAAFTWRSDDASVAVAQTGVITAAANGAAHVFAKTGAVESAGHAVTVAQVVASIAVSGGATLASLGETSQLAAIGLDAHAHPVAGLTFAWSVLGGSTDVLTVGAATGLVTAVANGQRTVVASAAGISGALLVTVAQAPATVTASAGGPTTLHSLGETVQLSASAADANGHPIAGATFSWRSSDAAVASVTAAGGLVTAAGNGTAQLFARAGDAESAGLAVTVAQVVDAVVVTPASPTVANGAAVQLTADPQDARGNHVAGAPAASWRSSNTAVATVSGAGLATGTNLGATAVSATITATVSGVDGSALLTVSGSGY